MLLHLGQNVITFRTLLHLGPFITFRPSTAQAPGRAYIWRGDLTEGFLRYRFGGLYLKGLIFGILRYTETFNKIQDDAFFLYEVFGGMFIIFFCFVLRFVCVYV